MSRNYKNIAPAAHQNSILHSSGVGSNVTKYCFEAEMDLDHSIHMSPQKQRIIGQIPSTPIKRRCFETPSTPTKRRNLPMPSTPTKRRNLPMPSTPTKCQRLNTDSPSHSPCCIPNHRDNPLSDVVMSSPSKAFSNLHLNDITSSSPINHRLTRHVPIAPKRIRKYNDHEKIAMRRLQEVQLEEDDTPFYATRPDENEILAQKRSFQQYVLENSCETTCTVCGNLRMEKLMVKYDAFPEPFREILKNEKYPLTASMKNYTEKFPEKVFPDIDLFKTTCIEPRGFIDGKYQICLACNLNLLQRQIPKSSVKRNFIGETAKCLDELNYIELLCICRRRTLANITTVKNRYHNGQRVHKGNSLFFDVDLQEFVNVLPLAASDLQQQIKLVLVGSSNDLSSFKNNEKMFVIRRDKILKCLIWLKANNIYYRDIVISEENLKSLPDHGIPDSLLYIENDDETVKKASVDADGNDETFVCGISNSCILDINANIRSTQHDVQTAAEKLSYIQDNKIIYPTKPEISKEFGDPALYANAFPHLFPFGYGAPGTDRQDIGLSPDSHMTWLLNYSDARFSHDRAFHFVHLKLRNKKKATASVRFKFKHSHKTNDEIAAMTKDDLHEAIQALKNNQFDNVKPGVMEILKRLEISTQNCPGSNAERSLMRKKIRSLIVQHGCPLFFVTINPADVHSPLFLNFVAGSGEILKEEIINMDNNALVRLKSKLLVQNPVAAAKFSNLIFEAFYKFLIGYGSKGVLGEPLTYAGTVEEQGRKSLHLHTLIWMKNFDLTTFQNSLHDMNIKEAFLEYLDHCVQTDFENIEYIPKEQSRFPIRTCTRDHTENTATHFVPKRHPNTCCDIAKFIETFECDRHLEKNVCSFHPYDTSDPKYELKRLYDLLCLIIASQIHVHNAGCFKHGKCCRMRMGRKPITHTCITEDLQAFTKRSHSYINNFNQHILECVRCNMDIKVLLSSADTKALLYYITNYITKKNTTLNSLLDLCAEGLAVAQTTIEKEGKSLSSAEISRRLVQSCYFKISASEEIGAPYSCFLQLGFKPFYCPETFIPLHWGTFSSYIFKHEEQLKLHRESYDDEICNSSDDEGIDDDKILLEEFSQHDDRIVYINQVADYRHRHEILGHLSPYDFCSRYKKIRGRQLDSIPFRPSHPQYQTHSLVKRAANSIPLINGRKIPNTRNMESFYRFCCLIFTSWNDVSNFDLNSSWEEEWHKRKSSSSIKLMENLSLLDPCEKPVLPDGDMDDGTYSIQRPFHANDENNEGNENFFEISEQQMENLVNLHITSQKSDLPTIVSQPGSSSNNPIPLTNVTLKQLHKDMVNATENSFVVPDDKKKDKAKGNVNNRATKPRIVNLQSPDLLMKQVAHSHNLRGRQRIAFYTFIHNMESKVKGLSNTPSQLIVLGEGGTGKTKGVLNAIKSYYKLTNREQYLLITSTTGTSAADLHARTVDSQLNLMGNLNPDLLRQTLGHLHTLVIDEAYFLGARKLAKINEALQIAKGNTLPWGGMNVLWLGDLYQLPPVRSQPLFLDITKWPQGPTRTGVELWRSIPNAIILRKNYRASDKTLRRILTNLRRGKLTDRDIRDLESRHISNISDEERLDFEDATYIVNENSSRQKIHCQHAVEFCEPSHLHTTKSIDRCKSKALTLRDQIALWELPDTPSRLSGLLTLAKGMTVIIRKNLYPALRIANGTMGIVDSISTNYVGVYFEHLKNRRFDDNLPKGVLPILKKSVSFEWNEQTISRKQYPMSPAKALTIHAVQGKTLKKAVVHLATNMKLSCIYVALSRVSNLKDLLLIGTSNLKALFQSKTWSQEILSEVQRIKRIQAPTMARILQLYPFLADDTLHEETMLELHY